MPAIRSATRVATGSASASTLHQKPSVELVYVFPLRGRPRTLGDYVEAIAFVESFDESKPAQPLTRYEVGVRYSNGDEIRGQFKDKATAIAFLRGMR